MSGDETTRGQADGDLPEDVGEALTALRGEIKWLRDEVSRLDFDLDESRRLNLRAAELLDIVFEQLGRPEQRI